MSLCSHTQLMNAAIWFCKHDESWIHPLADLGYEAKLVEQKIGTEISDKNGMNLLLGSNFKREYIIN